MVTNILHLLIIKDTNEFNKRSVWKFFQAIYNSLIDFLQEILSGK